MTNKREVNNAITNVLFAKFKYQVAEEIRLIESAGYSVKKVGSTFKVSSPVTKKIVYMMNESNYRRTIYTIYYGCFREMFSKFSSKEEIAKSFDFVSCLDTNYNSDYWDQFYTYRRYSYESKRITDYLDIRYTRKCYSDRIEWLQEQLTKAQKEVERLKKDLEGATKGFEQSTTQMREYCQNAKGMI